MALRDRLIEDWRGSWRLLSVQMGWASGAVSAAIIAAVPSLVINMLTMDLKGRIIVGLLIGAGVAFLPWLARILKQGKKGCDDVEAP